MTSEYFSNKNSFDQIEDPLKNSWGEYWHFDTKDSDFCFWNSGIFTDKEIENIKVIGKRVGCSESLVGHGYHDFNIRSSFQSWIKPNEHTSWIYERISNLLLDNNQKHFQFDLDKLEHIQFTYYNANFGKNGGHYSGHVDTIIWNVPDNRKLSAVIQLSSPDEYEGGELVIHHSANPMTIKKEKSFAVTFPSYCLHEVTPVTKGERYTLVAWAHGPSFK